MILEQTPTRTKRSRGPAAFTLVEMLVVIGVIGILAGLVLYMAGGAAEENQRKAAEALVQDLELAIRNYKDHKGVLPPDNPNDVKRPPLFYELKGTIVQQNGNYRTKDGEYEITPAEIQNTFGLPGFLNSQDPASETTPPRDFLETLKSANVKAEDGADGVRFVVFPRPGPEGRFNPVRYDKSSGNRHNLGQDGFDLWIDLSIGNKIIPIGNW